MVAQMIERDAKEVMPLDRGVVELRAREQSATTLSHTSSCGTSRSVETGSPGWADRL